MNRKKTDRLAACRQFYAKLAAAGGGQLREDLERAFEIVPREYFLGAGPWFAVSSLSGMVVATPTDDPIHVYQNVLFALDRQKRINNGEPFLHGQLLGALSPGAETWRFISAVGRDTTPLFSHTWSAHPGRSLLTRSSRSWGTAPSKT